MCLHENDTSDYHRVCRGCGLGSALHVWQKSISFTLVLQSHKSVPLAEHNQRRSPDLGADSDDEQQAHSKAGNGTKSCHDASTRWLHCCIWPGISRVPHLHVLRSFGVPNGGRLFVVSATIKGSIIIAEHHREFVGMGKPRKRSRGTDRPDSGWKPEGPGIGLTSDTLGCAMVHDCASATESLFRTIRNPFLIITCQETCSAGPGLQEVHRGAKGWRTSSREDSTHAVRSCLLFREKAYMKKCGPACLQT
jgi:hypothetical protein